MVERISELHDNLLCHILAFLPARSAVATCVLSKRWQKVWTNIPVLDLTIPENSIVQSGCILTAEKYTSLKNFMNRILLQNGASVLERVDLDVYSEIFKSKDLYEWFTLLGRRRIKEFKLSLKLLTKTRELPEVNPKPMELPLTYTLINQIVVLRLSGGFCAHLTVGKNSLLCLPRVEVLHIQEFVINTDDDVDDPVDLLKDCPVIRELALTQCLGFHRLSVCSSSLKKLEVSGMCDREITIIIKAPNLEYLELLDISTICEIDNLPSLVKAKFCILGGMMFTCELLSRLQNATTLSIRGDISLQGYCVDDQQLWDFHNLKCFEVACQGWQCLLEVMRMLKYMPNLVSLIIYKKFTKSSDKCCWPDIVPECSRLPLKLAYIEFHDFTGREDHSFEMVQWCLSHCMVLKGMKINIANLLSLEDKCEVVKKLVKLPRASSCEITIC